MSIVEIRDFVLWSNHIHGNHALRDELLALEAGTMVDLAVAGRLGKWVKMRNNKRTGEPMPGLKPIGPARTHWHELYRERRGDLVEIKKG